MVFARRGSTARSAYLLPFLLLLYALASGQSHAEPVRLAILPGERERAPGEEVLAQLEVALTAEKDVTLLERAEVRKILREQNLSAAGLTDPATAIRVGTLLAVEMFLFVEKIPNTDPAACRIQIIETKTGIALAGLMEDQQRLIDTPADIAKTIKHALAKQRVPMENRHYIGILGVRNEEPGQSLDGLARTLWMLLSMDLQDCPSLVLLDREHMQWLRQEHELTDMEQALKLSAVLLDGGLRRNEEGDKVNLTLLLTPLAGGKPEPIALCFDPGALVAFRKEVIAAVAEHLEVKAPALISDRAQEASRFRRQAGILARCGEKDAALRAAEAAYAIWPNATTRLALAYTYGDQVLDWPTNSLRHCFGHEWQRFHDATEEEQVRSLHCQARMLSLLCEQYQIAFPSTGEPSEENSAIYRDLGLQSYPGLGVVVRSTKGRAADLLPEVAALERRLFDIVIEAAKRQPNKLGGAYLKVLTSAMGNLFTNLMYSGHFEFAKEQAAGLRTVFELWRNTSAEHGQAWRDFGGNLQGWFGHLQRLSQPELVEARKPFIATFSVFKDDLDPIVRFTANVGLLRVNPAADEAAESVLKYIRDDVNYADYRLGRESSLATSAWQAVQKLGTTSPALAASYCEQIMSPWMKEGGDSWHVPVWGLVYEEWGRLVEKSKGTREAAEVYGRLLAALQDCQRRWPNYQAPSVRYKIGSLEAALVRLGTVVADAPAADDMSWAYVVRPLGLRLEGAKAATVCDDRLYVARWSRNPRGPRELIVTIHRFPEGGPPLRTGTVNVPVEEPLFSDDVWPEVIGGRLYVGTAGGLAVFTEDEPPRLLTERNGLPGTAISAMAVYGGKLYLGLGMRNQPKHAFAVYDPHDGTSRIIFSNTAVEAKRRRDVPISIILADESRKCLWIGAFGGNIFPYNPENGELEKPVEVRFGLQAGQDSHVMSFCPGGLIYLSPGGVSFLDLQTLKETWLLGRSEHSGPNGWDDKPVFGYPSGRLWPARYDGAVVITSGRLYEASMLHPASKHYLFVHRPAGEPLRQEMPGGIILFQETPHDLLALDSQGDGYLIRKKPSVLGEATKP